VFVSIDGGDVLRVGKTIYIGLSSRSNQAAVEQAQQILAPYGYTVQGVEVSGCLHLKSAVTRAAEKTLLLNPAWVRKGDFEEAARISVRRESHHLVFIQSHVETEMQSEHAVENAQRVQRRDLSQDQEMSDLSNWALERRIRRRFMTETDEPFEAWCARPEDVVVGKLMAWKEGRSTKHAWTSATFWPPRDWAKMTGAASSMLSM
jgi:hypothetical protein